MNEEVARKIDGYMKTHMKAAKKEIGQKVADGTATFDDAYQYASDAGNNMFDALLQYLPPGATYDDVMDLLPPELQGMCEDVLEMAGEVQQVHNQISGVGLSPVEIEPDADRIEGLAKHVAGKTDDEESPVLSEDDRLNIENLSSAAVDETIKENARFQARSGLEVTVSRVYDQVGLKDGDCKWCRQREGHKVPYPDALDRGMFQRHPGCGCRLTYETGYSKRHQADWTRNAWRDYRTY